MSNASRLRLAAAPLALVLAPSIVQGGAWVLPAGRSWVRLGALHQETRERYFLDTRRIPYFFDGRNRTSAAFLDLRHGFGAGLEASVQVPVYRLEFDDLADRRRSTGAGDVRLGVRWNVSAAPVVGTLGVAVKLPTGEFVNDAEVVPVGEGQYDLDVTAEAGRSFWPRRAYISILIGYRVRTRNAKNGIDPGNEWLWRAEGGHAVVSGLSLRLAVRGLSGGRSESFGLEIPTLRREAVYVEPAVSWDLGSERGVVVSLPFTVRGRNWPAGLAIGVGVYGRF